MDATNKFRSYLGRKVCSHFQQFDSLRFWKFQIYVKLSLNQHNGKNVCEKLINHQKLLFDETIELHSMNNVK